MKTIEHSAYLDYSAEQMYRLANDVAHYSEFLPWCAATKVISESETAMTASITVKKGPVEQSFTTDNTLDKNAAIHMQLRDGPFKTMTGQWTFKPLSDTACKASFTLQFEFESKLLALALSPLFEKIANTMIDAFVARAGEVYSEAGLSR